MQKKYTLKRLNDNIVGKRVIYENKFSINYQNALNPAQFEAASAVDGAYLIIAGAGTGKTRTLVYRVARLVELGFDPKSILLLTFTRKAANEMMNRAAVLLDNRCSKILGGTFHSFANLTLRKYYKALNLDSSFTILDQGDSEDVINLIRSQVEFITKEKRFPNKQTLNKVFSLSVNTGKPVEEIIDESYPHFLDQLDKIMDIRKVYSEYKRRNNLLDYDDLLVYLKNFLHDLSPSAKSLLSSIKFVMVDEYQDTNKLQAEVVLGLTQLNKNIMVVGDDSQSIYSFRGANFKNIIEFPILFPDTKIIKLEENYRSVQPVLDFTNKIIEGAVEKYEKHLYTRRTGGDLPFIVAASTENLQSKFIVDKILDLREEGVPLKDIAVLFRSSFFSFDLEIELNKANIPFQKFGGMKFIETAHIKDVLAFLRIAANPKDIISWYRVLLLLEGVGPKTAQKILDELATARLTIKANPDSQTSFRYNDTIAKLFQLLYQLHTKQALPSEKAQLVVDYYYPIFNEKYDDFNKRKKDLDIFLNITENYKSLDSLLADMAIEPIIDSVIDIEATDKEEEYVTLSTIHSAKGLEWHSVFIIHAVEGFFPSSRSVENLDTLEEERRLMYVASTRAKQNLFVTYPMNIFDREAGTTLSKPSRFISEMNKDLAQGWLLDEDF
ncbi:MAG: ATP-dependent DNA helicase [Ignavibacteria bacterium RIFOXYB2_FULL_35_12]|nr:MAG: ATP-dependent DNA helicase [Ignavibacteria bacterium GWF2_35_20]OGU87114.1 MAG: ATP-dependent DNA helicase [Ignavibacteria bacterium RIFOXYA12_FULL_35_25]OGU92480.1 MAG: ATP-dependent DNA helicase [Ignavibacteria bacterium RIFOXYC12_FULL_35_11]OGU95856.1 MAG: ATP-dependent DNA helicase [Ignavibacteria bacterium RIFOXYB12_FULL_35_14]OGV00968.1 MAG: ATP-dependent DNA helicase [Ignavibacteria bacterium RIFOXYC2_FULL_35_16]OGV05466.1 MAG: ATP-dependent DNA helicase [Ignavibacteria bacteriu